MTVEWCFYDKNKIRFNCIILCTRMPDLQDFLFLFLQTFFYTKGPLRPFRHTFRLTAMSFYYQLMLSISSHAYFMYSNHVPGTSFPCWVLLQYRRPTCVLPVVIIYFWRLLQLFWQSADTKIITNEIKTLDKTSETFNK